MKISFFLTTIVLTTVMTLFGVGLVSAQNATTKMINRQGQEIGRVTVERLTQGVRLKVALSLDKGSYGLHIHETGKCDPPGFKTAGGHFNPGNKKHGFNNPEGFHAGDLPNLHVVSGRGEQEIFLPGERLRNRKAAESHALIVHEQADDYQTDPSGKAGKRIACAVIEW